MSESRPLEKMQSMVGYFETRKARAKERLLQEPSSGWYFGIIGLRTPLETISIIPDIATIRVVTDPPGEIELAGALKNKSIFGAIGSYSKNITHELAIIDHAVDQQTIFNLAWWITSLIRVKSVAEILIPCVSNYSWSLIPGVEDDSCLIQFIEDVPLARQLEQGKIVTQSDFGWVSCHLTKFIELLEVPSLRLAVDALTTHNHLNSERMMIASLWSGIEAIFGINSELSFRISTYIAAVLESPGLGRNSLYHAVREGYSIRSKAVHGAKLSAEAVQKHILDVRLILSRLICDIVERGQPYSESLIESLLFGDSSSQPIA